MPLIRYFKTWVVVTIGGNLRNEWQISRPVDQNRTGLLISLKKNHKLPQNKISEQAVTFSKGKIFL
jgi:hypothetical protein